MRAGATQSTPTASPDIRITIGNDEYRCQGAGGNERVVSFHFDEQVWGGSYEILLDNSDGALDAKDYDAAKVDIGLGFVGQTLSLMPHLWVFRQGSISVQGKVLTRLVCIDGWGMLAQAKFTFGQAYYNQEWQKDENIDNYTLPSGDPIPSDLRASLVARSNVTLWWMLQDISGLAGIQLCSYYGDPWDDAALDRKPPISFANPISGMRQAIEMTKSHFLWWRLKETYGGINYDHSVLRHVMPHLDGVCYSYSTANSFFQNVQDQGLVVPNRIRYWAFNEDGSDWIYGEANDVASQQAIVAGTPANPDPWWDEIGEITGIISRNYILTPEWQVDGRSNEADLAAIAESTLDKIRQERGQGFLVAPMHCSQELFDKISVVDGRTGKTTTGHVHRIVREYDRGKYQITLYLGGVTSGLTQDMGGNYAVPLHEAEPPRAPILGAGIGTGDCVWMVRCGTAMLRPARASFLQIPVGVDMYHQATPMEGAPTVTTISAEITDSGEDLHVFNITFAYDPKGYVDPDGDAYFYAQRRIVGEAWEDLKPIPHYPATEPGETTTTTVVTTEEMAQSWQARGAVDFNGSTLYGNTLDVTVVS